MGINYQNNDDRGVYKEAHENYWWWSMPLKWQWKNDDGLEIVEGILNSLSKHLIFITSVMLLILK